MLQEKFGMKKCLSVLLAFIMLAYASLASAAGYPEKPVTVWHPFAPRVSYDTIGEYYSTEMEKMLGQPFVMKHGLKGEAARQTLQAPADGYHIFYAGMGPLALGPLMEHVDFTLEDFRPIGRVTLLPIVLFAGKNAPFSTYEGFVEYAKAHPGKVRIAITNKPSSLQIGMTYFIRKHTDLDVQLLEQSSPKEAAEWLLDGRVDMLLTHPPDAERWVKSGDFVPLATFAGKRLPVYPDVPTMRELGYDWEQTSWRALRVRRDTPEDVVRILEEASAKIYASEGAQNAVRNWETIAWMGSEETEAFLYQEVERYKKMAAELGMLIRR